MEGKGIWANVWAGATTLILPLFPAAIPSQGDEATVGLLAGRGRVGGDGQSEARECLSCFPQPRVSADQCVSSLQVLLWMIKLAQGKITRVVGGLQDEKELQCSKMLVEWWTEVNWGQRA